MNCKHCGALLLAGPLCCKARFEELLDRHEAMAAKRDGSVRDRIVDEDVLAREAAVLDRWIDEVPAKDRGALRARLNTLEASRAVHSTMLDGEVDAEAARRRGALASARAKR